MERLAILASGTGSNARKIIEYFAGKPEVEVVLVASNRSTAPVLDMAREHGVPTFVLRRKDFYESENFLELLREKQVTWVVLAGFLWLVPQYLVHAFRGRMVNIHPALLPAYGGKGMYGMHVHRAVKEAGEEKSGITIHQVNDRYDEGDIVFQATCRLEPDDTPETIAKKVQALEHRHFAPVLEKLMAEADAKPPDN